MKVPWFLQLHPLHLLASLMEVQLILSDACIFHVDEEGVFSTWWTGKFMARRKGLEILQGSSWTRASSQDSNSGILSG